MGIIGCRTVDGKTRFSTRPIRVCAGVPWVARYLQAVVGAVFKEDTTASCADVDRLERA